MRNIAWMLHVINCFANCIPFSKLQTSMSPSPPTAHFDTYSAVAKAIHVTSGFEILKHQSVAAILNKTKPG